MLDLACKMFGFGILYVVVLVLSYTDVANAGSSLLGVGGGKFRT